MHPDFVVYLQLIGLRLIYCIVCVSYLDKDKIVCENIEIDKLLLCDIKIPCAQVIVNEFRYNLH